MLRCQVAPRANLYINLLDDLPTASDGEEPSRCQKKERKKAKKVRRCPRHGGVSRIGVYERQQKEWAQGELALETMQATPATG